jgi:hypothetical protein
MGALDDAIREHLELKRQHGASDDEIRRAEAEALGPARRDSAADAIDAAEPAPAAGHFDEPVHDEEFVQEEPGAAATGDHLVTDPPPPPPPPPPPDTAADPYLVAEPDASPVEPHPVEPVAEHEPLAADAPGSDAPAPPPPVAPPAPDEPLHEAPAPGTPKPHGDPAFDHEEEPPARDDIEAYEPAIDADRARTAILDDPLDELAPLDQPPPHQPPLHHEPGPDDPPAPARPPAASEPVDPAAHDAAPRDEDVLEETPDFLQETPEHDRLWFEQKPPRDFDFDD